MKKISILFIAASFFLIQCNNESKSTDKIADDAEFLDSVEVAEELPATTVEFSEEEFNFGDIKEGEKVAHVFTFKNTGENPLVIKSAVGSCGCTVPKFSNEPIAPGESGEINVEFDSSNKPGINDKMVTVMANTDKRIHILKVKSNVVPK
jgi:hypothetical protein